MRKHRNNKGPGSIDSRGNGIQEKGRAFLSLLVTSVDAQSHPRTSANRDPGKYQLVPARYQSGEREGREHRLLLRLEREVDRRLEALDALLVLLVVLVRRDARDGHPGRREDAQFSGCRRGKAAVLQHERGSESAGLRDADGLQDFHRAHRELAAPVGTC